MSNDRYAIFPEGGPKPAGPYSPAIVSMGFVFVSGQVGIDPVTGQLAGDTIEAQTRQVLKNLGTVLRSAGCDFKDVVKTGVYITKPEFFQIINEIYQEFFSEPYPARWTMVCVLPKDEFLIGIDAIACLPSHSKG